MCGICGIINFNQEPVREEKIRKMMKRMKHRGPDDDGVFMEDNVGLGFVRLSILDLSEAGHQPMFSSDNVTMRQSDNEKKKQGDKVTRDRGRFVIVYNGEVYNYVEIRAELKSKGYIFNSNTDTEVVLNSYIEWGEDCLHKFNGMWAFCIFDRKEKELFFARDRFGVKPFYYFVDDSQFIFASEIPPILQVLERKLSPNNQAIFDYMVFNRTDQTEMTFFEGIKKLQHGHSIRFKIEDSRLSDSRLKIRRWYDLREKVTKLQGDKETKLQGEKVTKLQGDKVTRLQGDKVTKLQGDKEVFEEYRELLSSAVGLRLRSDVPVGVCLSGGLDSSSIVSILLKDYDKRDLNTFSAVYNKGEVGDEKEFINEYKGLLKNMYFTTPDADSLHLDMKNFVMAQCEPVPSSFIYAQFKVMELAKNYVVVTLDGQGADEQLAGYHYFYGFLFKYLLKTIQLKRLLSEVQNYLRIHKSVFGLKTSLYFMTPRFLKSELRVQEKRYLNKEFSTEYSKDNDVTGNIYASKSLNDALLDHFEYKLEHLLKWEDRNSMWFSLEARVPFLDFRLVEFTLSLPDNYKILNGQTKYILRKSLNNTLPDKIKNRQDKIGFEAPAKNWLKNEKFRKYIHEGLDSLEKMKIADSKRALRIYQQHLDGKIDINKEIWKWINLNLWYEEFF